MRHVYLYDICDRIVAVPLIVLVLGIACGTKAFIEWCHG